MQTREDDMQEQRCAHAMLVQGVLHEPFNIMRANQEKTEISEA